MTRESTYTACAASALAAGWALTVTLVAGCWNPGDSEALKDAGSEKPADGSADGESAYASGGNAQGIDIGSAGGRIELEAGAALIIPTGALDRQEPVALHTMRRDEVPGLPQELAASSEVLEVTPHGLELQEAATLQLPYERVQGTEGPPRVLRLADRSATEWEVLPDADYVDNGSFVDVDLRRFSFYVVGVPRAAGAAVEPPPCEEGKLRCSSPEDVDLSVDFDPSLFGGLSFQSDIIVCTEEGWELAEDCVAGETCVAGPDGDPRCECGGEDQSCCLNDTDNVSPCEQGLQCLEGWCKSSCECPGGGVCVTDGNEITGFDFRCPSNSDALQCEADGQFVTSDDQGVSHLVDHVKWSCDRIVSTSSPHRCATRKGWSSQFGMLVDRAECVATTSYRCTRGTDFEEEFCKQYEACMVCTDVTYSDSDPPETTHRDKDPDCYSGISTDPACSLMDPETQEVYEWRCPPDTTCSTTKRGRCERTAGPFYEGDGHQVDRNCY